MPYNYSAGIRVSKHATYLARTGTDAGSEAMHTRMYALLRWRTYRTSISEFLEHLASDNGADCINIIRYTLTDWIGMF